MKAFDVICGSTQGGWTERMMAFSIVEFIQKHCEFDNKDSAYSLWEELAGQSDEDIDVISWTEELELECNDLLPASCSFEWVDNELRIQPYVDEYYPSLLDGTLERLTEDNDGTPVNPYDHDIVYEVNDHGNVTCYEWVGYDALPQWHERWSMV